MSLSPPAWLAWAAPAAAQCWGLVHAHVHTSVPSAGTAYARTGDLMGAAHLQLTQSWGPGKHCAVGTARQNRRDQQCARAQRMPAPSD